MDYDIINVEKLCQPLFKSPTYPEPKKLILRKFLKKYELVLINS